MKVLVLNCGSSSVKYKVFDMPDTAEPLIQGIAERIGIDGSSIHHKTKGANQKKLEKPLQDHDIALREVCGLIAKSEILASKGDNIIEAIGHRVVHGGPNFCASVLIDQKVKDAIKQSCRFAPLHNPANIAGIEVCEQIFSGIPNIAVFDTAVHQTMPPRSYLYGIPIELFHKYGIRRYGFQGISHSYVANEAARILNKNINTLNIITCHLGNGSSVTAFKKGESIDTSMGLTPLEGLVMATRCGDIDPSITLYLIESIRMSAAEVNNMLNKNSGLKGLCNKSDMRDILEDVNRGVQTAKTALEVYCYRIQKYIGAYVAAMNGVDVIVFTGGIGENSMYVREKVLENFDYVGLKLHKTKNQKKDTIFSTDDSAVKVMNIPTNEELYIALETYKAAEKAKSRSKKAY